MGHPSTHLLPPSLYRIYSALLFEGFQGGGEGGGLIGSPYDANRRRPIAEITAEITSKIIAEIAAEIITEIASPRLWC